MKKLFLVVLLISSFINKGHSLEPTDGGGWRHSLFLCENGIPYATGSNDRGRLGNGTTTSSTVPIQVSNLTGITAVSAGSAYSMALKSDGTVWAWGPNVFGNIGDNTTTNRLTPVQVHGPNGVGFLTGIIAISAGASFSLALKNDGTVWAWGTNGFGECGVNSTQSMFLTPVKVIGLSGITAISAGGNIAMALKNDGTVWGWGYNNDGELGDNTTILRRAPVQARGINNVGFLTGIAAISAGGVHTLALGTNGIVYASGRNGSGELGNGTTTNSLTYVQCVNVPANIIAVSAGGYFGSNTGFSLALRNDGTAWAWGDNSGGTLGNSTNANTLTVTQVSGLTGINSINAGWEHCHATKNDGTKWAWGMNGYGQLGDGTITDRLTPVQSLLSCPAKVNPPECKLLSIDKAVTNGQNSSVVLSTLPGYPTITGKNITITGTLNIDQNITFAGCNVQMATNAKINLTSGNLTLTGKTHIYSCTSLWDGIYVPAGRTITVTGDALIEDALNAVVSTGGGVYTITTAIFNKNLIAIDVRSYGSTHTGSILNTVISSRVIPSFASTASNQTVANLKTGSTITSFASTLIKSPYNDRKGCYGLNAEDVANINIGSPISTAFLNLFDGIQCGINLIRSNSVINNNKFQYLTGYTSSQIQCPSGLPGNPPPPCYVEAGYGIKAKGTYDTGTNSVYIGGVGNNQPNSFYNIFQAINISNYQNIDVWKNTIDNVSTGPFPTTSINYGNAGVYVIAPTTNNKIYIDVQPLIRNCKDAIFVNRTYNNALSTDLYIRSNVITANAGGYCTNGVYVTDLLNGTFTNLNGSWAIEGNTISEVTNGINLLNVKSPSGGQKLGVGYNLCSVRYASTGSINGILTKGCSGIKITDNHTKCNSTAAALSGGNLGVCGIHLQNSTNMLVKCNQMDDAARSLVFEGTCTSILTTNNAPEVGITTNIMQRAQDGFVLLGSGIIGSQGNASVASNNVWNLPVSSFSRAQTMADGSNANNSILYLANTATTLPVNNAQIFPGTFYSPSSLLNSTGIAPACNNIRQRENTSSETKGGDLIAYGNELKRIADDVSKLPLFNEESHWMRKQFVFNELKNNATLKSNTSLQSFYNSTKHNYAQLTQVEDKILIEKYIEANAINNSITVSNTIESNQKTVNDLILKKLLNPSYVYLESDKNVLTQIANQCPLSGGGAVYQARVLLMTIAGNVIEFEDNCSQTVKATNRTATNIVTDSENVSFKIYPNPNDGNMTLEYSLSAESNGMFLLYDISGREVNKYLLTEGESKQLRISENTLANGVYFYTVIVDNVVKARNKVIISK